MDTTIQTVITIVCSVIASSGFWAYLQRRSEKSDVRTKMLLGLAHDRLTYLGMHYINRVDENGERYITHDEYENFYEYLYKPYAAMGGNGSAKRIKMEVDMIPLRSANYGKKKEK